MRPKKLTRSEIAKIVRAAIDDAMDFVSSEIEPRHIKAQRYYDGKVDLKHDDGRSAVVATKCRDAVRQVKPSLLRVFMSTAKPVEFVPKGPEDAASAEQQTAFAQYAFAEAKGYQVLYSVFHDALVKAPGIAKVWWDEAENVDIEDYSNMKDDDFVAMAADDDVQVLEHDQREEQTPAGPMILHDCKIARTSKEGKLAIRAIPPEDFFVDSNATSIEDAYISGHRTTARLGDLISMGFKWSEIENLGEESDDDDTEFERRGYVPEDEEGNGDPSMKPVTIYEAYMKMDIEGAGLPRLYAFILAGKDKKLLSYELCGDAPFAVFDIDPEPHAFFGHSLVDLLIEDQNAGTSMLRGMLDNVHIANNPGLAIDENMVNIEDTLNNEIGRIIRVKGSPAGSIMESGVSFNAGGVLPALQYFDQVIESKTGVSRASLGLNADALQSTTATAVQATVSGAEGQVEVMARNLAEGGMKRLFRLILKASRNNVSPETFMRLDGRFVPVQPDSWNIGMDLSVNVGLGTNRREERSMALREALQMQLSLAQMGSPLVTQTQIRNTLADILDSAGLHNADRYYAPMDPQTEQMLQQQAAQSQQGAPDPNAAIAQAEIQKSQISAQAKLQSDQAKYQIEMQKAAMDDDFRRDELEQDAILKLTDMQRQDVQSEAAAIRQLQAQPRQP